MGAPIGDGAMGGGPAAGFFSPSIMYTARITIVARKMMAMVVYRTTWYVSIS
jgi:hypothetical protein